MVRPDYGWRMTYVLFGVASVVLIVPLGVFFVRNTPEALGLTPDGLPAAPSAGPVASIGPIWPTPPARGRSGSWPWACSRAGSR